MTLKSHLERLENKTKIHAANASSRNKTIKLGTVSSFDPNTYAVKVKWQPFFDSDGQTSETGEAPLMTINASNLEGILCPPNIGDQCVVGFVDGDMQQPVILGFIYSDEDRPVLVTSGEFLVTKVSGSNSATLHLKNDGTIEITASQTINLTAPQVNLMADGGIPESLVKYSEMKALFDAHTHDDSGAGVPTIPMSTAQATINTKAT